VLQHTATRRNTLQQQLTLPLAHHSAISSQHGICTSYRSISKTEPLNRWLFYRKSPTIIWQSRHNAEYADHLISLILLLFYVSFTERAPQSFGNSVTTPFYTAQHTATRCNALHRPAAHCDAMQHTATATRSACNTPQHTAPPTTTLSSIGTTCDYIVATPCHTPQQTATLTLQHAATHNNDNSQFYWPDRLPYHRACSP